MSQTTRNHQVLTLRKGCETIRVVHTMIVSFTVSGAAKPKGSMRAFVPKGWTRPVLTSSSTSVKAWEQTIRAVAQGYAESYTTGAVRVRLCFALPRPQRLSRQASRLHTKRPDVDKLARAALDALTGVLWKDDSQVCSLIALKAYARPDEAPHVVIQVRAKT